VTAGPGDIFDKLDFGYMIYGEARKGPWAFGLDVLYMDLGEQGNTPSATYDVGVKQAAYIFSVYRRLGPRIEAMAGATVNHLNSEFSTSGPFAIDAGDSKTWVDPTVGGRVELLRTPVGRFADRSRRRVRHWVRVCMAGISASAYRASTAIASASPIGHLEWTTRQARAAPSLLRHENAFGPELGIGFHF
jgi:hypothetical protein